MRSDNGSGKDLTAVYDSLIAAAGGIDEIVTMLVENQGLRTMASCTDLGHDGLSVALTDFADVWTAGLAELAEVQKGNAQAIRDSVSDYLNTDVDIAAAMRAQMKGLDSL